MKAELLVSHLNDAVDRYSKLPFEKWGPSHGESKFEEIGTPSENHNNYCQIEVELLDRFIEDEVEALHIPIFARDEYRVFGTDLFIYEDGRIRWNKVIYEFIGGIPKPWPQ